MTNLHVIAEPSQRFEIKVDLDDRAFLFPSGKQLVQISFIAEGQSIHLDAAYAFNQSRASPRLLTLNRADGRELARKLIDAVYAARTQIIASETTRITITVIANGYHFQIGDLNDASELFLSTGCIWRVCHGLLRALDSIAPIETN